MTTSASAGTDLAARLAAVVAATLRVPVALVEPGISFSSLGMDSLAAVELTAAIEDTLDVDLPITTLHEIDDLDALVAFLEGHTSLASRNLHARLRQDARLPAGITPRVGGPATASRTADAQNVLLTGATGFVGAHVLRTLLDETSVVVTCLVRSAADDPLDRVRRNLDRYGLQKAGDFARIRTVRGDLGAFLLGTRAERFVRLAEEVDAIYHGAASVNWVHGYESLRHANVVGTREIIRLACTGSTKPVHFLSSIGVCYSTRGPRVVEETDDMLPAIDGLHLGYAQSKCVAESLLRAAARRGLPVTITRPALVSGESRSGRSNVDDLLARFIAGCIRLGAAPDLDWRVDCVPVDHVAQAVVRLSRAHVDGLSVAHLVNPRSRHWRECVLWMRLCGYDIELLPYREWLQVLRATTDASNPLVPLRPFFLRTVATEDHLTLPELFEESRRSITTSHETRRRLDEVALSCQPLDARLLDRYFDHYVAEALVPPTPRHAARLAAASRVSVESPDVEPMLPRITATLAERFVDSTLRVHALSVAPFDTDDSIVAELTSWRHGVCSGLFRATLAVDGATTAPRTVDLVVKAKAADRHVIDVAVSVAQLASPELGALYTRFRDDIGFTRSHVRELALYTHENPRIRRHTPLVYATHCDDGREEWLIAMERVEHSGPSSNSAPWPAADLDVALGGLAEIHSVCLGRETELRAHPWLAPDRDARRLIALEPLWRGLARHAKSCAPHWRNSEIAAVHDRLIAGIATWAAAPSGPRTLIHNDFNSRNVTVRSGPDRRLCAFDWELATIGLPQRDLAEILAFTLSPHVEPGEVMQWIERYRLLLEHATQSRLDPHQWLLGFRYALGELLIDRLAMYALIDRFRPQPFLSRVVTTWLGLFRAVSPRN